MKSAYWAEASDDHGTYVGRAWPFVDHCMALHRRWRSTSPGIYHHSIDLDEDGLHERGEIYNITYLFHKEDDGLDTWHERYLDCYEKRGLEWRILTASAFMKAHTQKTKPMLIAAEKFRQGDFDRNDPSALS
jgi:hypothetical protein